MTGRYVNLQLTFQIDWHICPFNACQANRRARFSVNFWELWISLFTWNRGYLARSSNWISPRDAIKRRIN